MTVSLPLDFSHVVQLGLEVPRPAADHPATGVAVRERRQVHHLVLASGLLYTIFNSTLSLFPPRAIISNTVHFA